MQPRRAAVGAVATESHGEQVTATLAGSPGAWVELRRYFDLGWRIGARQPDALGDGLFNLYHLDAASTRVGRLSFSFATRPWELVGSLLALAVLVAALLLARRELRRPVSAGAAAPASEAPPEVRGSWPREIRSGSRSRAR